MAGFKLSLIAKDDLKGIAKYTERNWGREQRNQYLLQFDRCFHQLAENPDLGRACDEIRSGYRKCPQASHIVFYRVAPNNAVEIIRILHKRMVPELQVQ